LPGLLSPAHTTTGVPLEAVIRGDAPAAALSGWWVPHGVAARLGVGLEAHSQDRRGGGRAYGQGVSGRPTSWGGRADLRVAAELSAAQM
jgi:hypothetical protein